MAQQTIQETEALRRVTVEHLHRVAEALRSHVPRISEQVLLNTGAWSNDHGIISSYLTCYPFGDVSEESIDAVITLVPGQHGVQFTADLCRSDGDIIAVIADRELQAGSWDELLAVVDQEAKAASQAMLVRLKELIATT